MCKDIIINKENIVLHHDYVKDMTKCVTYLIFTYKSSKIIENVCCLVYGGGAGLGWQRVFVNGIDVSIRLHEIPIMIVCFIFNFDVSFYICITYQLWKIYQNHLYLLCLLV